MSDWDIVLRGRRVIDPESGLDAVRDVAIAGGRVAEIGSGLPPRAGRIRRHRPGGCSRVRGPAQSRGGRARPPAAGAGWRHHRADADSTRPSSGIVHVPVNGTFVVRNADIVAAAQPGRPVRAAPR